MEIKGSVKYLYFDNLNARMKSITLKYITYIALNYKINKNSMWCKLLPPGFHWRVPINEIIQIFVWLLSIYYNHWPHSHTASLPHRNSKLLPEVLGTWQFAHYRTTTWKTINLSIQEEKSFEKSPLFCITREWLIGWNQGFLNNFQEIRHLFTA